MPVEFDRSNWVEIHWDYIVYACLLKALDAGGIWPVELGGNPLRLHCICLPVKGFRCQSNLTGWIGWKSIEITLYACLVELCGHPLGLHCICLPVKGFRCHSNSTSRIGQIGWKSTEIMSGRIGRIGWKSIEITLYAYLAESVKLGIISMDFHPVWPVINAWSNWTSSHGFSPNSTTQFD